MMTELPPGMVMMLAGAVVPFLPHGIRQCWMLLALGLSAYGLMAGAGVHWQVSLAGFDLVLHRADSLTLPFAIAFHIAAGLNIFYGFHEKRWLEHTAGFIYAGAAIAALHAGDLITLFLWWEATAVTSVFLILARRTEVAYRASMRYLIFQVLSGVLLLAGAAMLYQQSGSFIFSKMQLNSPGAVLVFLAFGIKAAFPLLNGWLQDAYPEATVLGTVILSAFTTKLAIYALARGFAGTEVLIWIGVLMASSVVFAVLENDLRRVLAYSLNNQLGFMVVGIGIGSEMAVNGAVAHAFVSILYKSLLFMCMGAVLFRVETVKATALGGLYRMMPLTAVFCIIGAMSISAFPLFSGFVAKSLIMSGLGKAGLASVYLLLMFASVGVLVHSGLKIPYAAFFCRDAGHQVKEAPFNMLLAMGMTALLCLGIGIYPDPLYALLPYPVAYEPYTLSHITGQLQLVLVAVLGFVFFVRFGHYPAESKSVVLNSDWFYRRLAARIGLPLLAVVQQTWLGFTGVLQTGVAGILALLGRMIASPLAGPVIPGPAALVLLVVLALMMAGLLRVSL